MEITPGSKRNIAQDSDFNTNGGPKYRRHMKDLRRQDRVARQARDGPSGLIAPDEQTESAGIRAGQTMSPSFYHDIPVTPCPLATSADGIMEDLFEFLFNASGRVNRAKYWRSLIVFGVAGPFTAVILFTAAGIAAPLFMAMLVVVLIPWLIWGFVIHTERLHDRDKSAWWLLVLYALPALLGPVARMASFSGARVQRCTTS
jgi:uncharacterized membrane protein YhaH (DUF805 family)